MKRIGVEWFRHFVHRSGHHLWRIIFWFNIVALVTQFAPVPDRAKSIVLAAGILTIGFAFIFGSLAHQKTLCEPCIAEMPLNGPALAEKWDRYLATFHWLFASGMKRWAAVMVVWLGFNLITGRLLSDNASTVVTFIPATASIMIIMRHNRVYPWCKRCGWDEGNGGFIEMPDPDPSKRVPA